MTAEDFDDDNRIGRIIGIDPGSTTMGFSVIEYDLGTFEIVRTFARTFNAGKMKLNELDIANHSERYARIYMLADAIYSQLLILQPTFVIAESPYMTLRRPQAYGALMEVVFAIRSAVRMYDPTMQLDLVDPPSAKMAVGAGGNAKKEQVHAALRKLLAILHFDEKRSDSSFDELDEHASDGLAIAYFKWKKITQD